MAKRWKLEFYEDIQGRRPVERWLDGLGDQKVEAVLVALREVLAASGINLASGAWLKALGGGLYEFRIRHRAQEIREMYRAVNQSLGSKTESIVLRIFVSFEGDQVIILLGVYDKGKNDKQGFQQAQIEIARKRLRDWKRRRV